MSCFEHVTCVYQLYGMQHHIFPPHSSRDWIKLAGVFFPQARVANSDSVGDSDYQTRSPQPVLHVAGGDLSDVEPLQEDKVLHSQ